MERRRNLEFLFTVRPLDIFILLPIDLIFQLFPIKRNTPELNWKSKLYLIILI